MNKITTSQTRTRGLLAPLAPLALLLLAATAGTASAQVAGGTTTVGISVVESTRVAMGWSAKKSLLGKTVYNETGQKVGKVEDLIISPDKNLSYVIVGAGGFVGIGRHDVAVPVGQIQDKAGRLVMAGASKDLIKALPVFEYASDTGQRDRFVAAAEADIAKGKTKVAQLEKQAGTVAADVKAKMDMEIAALQIDVKAAESKLGELKNATAVRWHEFEAGVSAATSRLRNSVSTAKG